MYQFLEMISNHKRGMECCMLVVACRNHYNATASTQSDTRPAIFHATAHAFPAAVQGILRGGGCALYSLQCYCQRARRRATSVPRDVFNDMRNSKRTVKSDLP